MKKIMVVLLFISLIHASEQDIIDTFLQHVSVSSSVAQKFKDLVTHNKQYSFVDDKIHELPLVQAYSGFATALPYVTLGTLPTPVEHLAAFGKELGLEHLYIKRDDKTGTRDHFGGNKARKLRFILGDAIRENVPALITIGAAGSNHALATADYGEMLGFKTHLFLIPQAKGAAIERNLLWGLWRRARPTLCPTKELRDIMLVAAMLWYKQTTGRYPYFIPAGGSYPLGAVGFVDAAFELRNQIMNKEIPEPRYIYVTLGSGGTVAGLILGLRAAGLTTKVIAVTVEPSDKATWYTKVLSLIKKTNELLHAADASFPLFDISAKDFDIVTDFGGERYGVSTVLGLKAKTLLYDTHNIQLDTTYTAKTCSALINHAHKGIIDRSAPVLLWHTYCADDLPAGAQALDYHELPYAFHTYFE